MSEFADDIQEAAESLTESDEYQERFDELFQSGVEEDLEVSENLNRVMRVLTDEFLIEDDNWQTDAGPMGDLLVESFKRATAEKFILEVRERAGRDVFDWSQVDIDGDEIGE